LFLVRTKKGKRGEGKSKILRLFIKKGIFEIQALKTISIFKA